MLQIADRQTGESACAPAALVYDLADKVRMRAVAATAAVAAAIGVAEAQQFAPTSSPDARCYHVRIRCHSTLAHCALGSGPERQPAPRSASPAAPEAPDRANPRGSDLSHTGARSQVPDWKRDCDLPMFSVRCVLSLPPTLAPLAPSGIR